MNISDSITYVIHMTLLLNLLWDMNVNWTKSKSWPLNQFIVSIWVQTDCQSTGSPPTWNSALHSPFICQCGVVENARPKQCKIQRVWCILAVLFHSFVSLQLLKLKYLLFKSFFLGLNKIEISKLFFKNLIGIDFIIGKPRNLFNFI